MTTLMRSLVLVAGGLLLAATAACGSADEKAAVTAPTGEARLATPGSAAPSPSPNGMHFKAGQTAQVAGEGLASRITISDPKIVKAPDDWSDQKIVIATVAISAIEGSVTYSPTAFALVLPDGTHIDANTVISDDGLPGHALSTGTLAAPAKAKGLVTFSTAPKSLAGLKIAMADEGRDWALG